MDTHGLLYGWLRDQGSFIAGLLALAAGALAYWAGRIQARVTRESAAAQVKAVNEQAALAHADARSQIDALERQIDQRNRELAELRSRAMVETVRALSTESARIERYARDRITLAEEYHSPATGVPLGAYVSVFRIDGADALNNVSVADFRGTGIMPAATRLKAMVDVLASALESAGAIGVLTSDALRGHLTNVITAANALKERLAQWEIDNPVAS